jgi:hypothetical protein
MPPRRFIEVLAVLSGLIAVAVLFLALWEWPPRTDRALHTAIGQALARETLKLARLGGRVTVITRDTSEFRQPALDTLLRSLRRELEQGGATVALQVIQLDPLRPVEVPAGDFYELIRRAGADQVIVSLLGPPLLTEEQCARLGAVKPKIVSFCPGNLAETVDLRRLFDAGLLHVAVINRTPPTGAGGKPAGPARGFDELYTVVRATEAPRAPTSAAAL